jgi:hypothetical protein
VAVANKPRSNRMRPPLLRPAPGPPGQNGREVERRTAPRATNRLAHRAFANRNQPSGI